MKWVRFLMLWAKTGVNFSRYGRQAVAIIPELTHRTDHFIHLTVSCHAGWVTAAREQIADVAWRRPNIKHGGSYLDNIIDFAGVHEAHKGVAHDYKMKVGPREGGTELR